MLLLEAHEDFEREFRGDTLAPATLEILDEPGFADRLLQLPHSKVFTLTGDIADGPVTLADFRLLKTRFPFIALIPQTAFLSFVVAEARRLPTFQVVMGASVQELVQEDEGIRGVRYRGHSGWHEVRALLTVGADGRFSKVRQLARMEPVRTSPPMDVLWFRLPRRPEETRETFGRFGRGHVVVVIDRGDWQIGYVIRKDGYQQLRQTGLEALRRSLRGLLPELADRLDTLTDWRQISLLSVESNRLRRWYRPGLLLIGDAAHAMSPIGGVGINYAIQDAVVAANVLAGPLASGWLRLRDLAEVQRQRELPTRLIQGFQHVPQRRCSLAPFSYCAGPLLVVRDAVAASTETTSGGGGMGTPCRPLRDVLTETGDCRAARGKHHPLAAIVCLLTVYGVSSLGAPRADAARVLRRPRPRWRIENRSHWVRAASVDEAHSQVRCGSTAQVMAALRTTAIGLLHARGATNITAACRHLAVRGPTAGRAHAPTENPGGHRRGPTS